MDGQAGICRPSRRESRGKPQNQPTKLSAKWASGRGSSYIALQVTEQNNEARSLYKNLGMEVKGSYHYRVKF